MNRQNRTATATSRVFALCAAWLLLFPTACTNETNSPGSGSQPGAGVCIPQSTRSCICLDNSTGVQTCLFDGSDYSDCVCGGNTGNPGVSSQDASVAPPPPPPVVQPDSSQPQPTGGSSGSAPPPTDASVTPPPPPPDAGTVTPPPTDATIAPPIDAGRDGGTGQTPTGGNGSAGAAGGGAGAAGTGPTNPNDDLDAVRQACVDHINMYRATLNLEPLARATPEQEACTDEGSRTDSELYYSTGVPHSSAGRCVGGSQNTCPMLRVGGWGPATLTDAIKGCLDAMWAEGMPPIGREACEADASGCFMEYGHYLNMSRENTTVVSCGFYEMSPGEWWSNQDFDMQWRW